ncbi:hypothetical protein LPJ53_002022 [Coemansia erecta]|uniref:MFS general substrate transporter n=1 Tax=Coemansia erecta TaxID=147472 RepID=A0A9W8CS84_9FUNG|nr:hypothetical protein LPJ53_002022 [Coemansia erecta]
MRPLPNPLGSALLKADLRLRETDYSTAASLFYPAYLVFQPLSNWCLKRFGARIWLPLLVLLWGAVITGQAFVRTRVGTLISGPIALGLTSLDGRRIHGWHALFFVEGVITMIWSLVIALAVPNYPDNACILSESERQALAQTLNSEKPEAGRRKINTGRFVRCLFNPTMLLISLTLFCANIPLNTIMLFGPQVVKDMGFSSSQAQAMQALPGFFGLVGIVMASWYVKWFGSHFKSIVFTASAVVLGGIILLTTLNVVARMFALCLLGFGGFGMLGIGPGWLATNVASNVTLGGAASSVFLICGGMGGIVASNIYRNQDAPRYLLGHGINLMSGAVAIMLAALARYNMARINRRKTRNPMDISALSYDDIQCLEERHPDFRYIY